MVDKVRIAIVSDLHCRYGDGKNVEELDTYLTSDLLYLPIVRNPVEALKKVIDEQKIKVDALICPGDIADRVNLQGLVSGWRYLTDLKIAMGAPILAATIGNHDIDSRKLNGGDPVDQLKRLARDFPTASLEANSNFWANHFCIISTDRLDILLINSCHFHLDAEQAKESKIGETTLEQIKTEIATLKRNGKIKLAICHHHPLKHSNMDYKDLDSIDDGDKLLKELQANDFALVIHGHKHDPRLGYSNSLPVFAAGSFSSITNLMNTGAENTFHLIEIEPSSKKGLIKSWIYGPQVGWVQKDGTYFPCSTGFGVRKDMKDFAEECAKWLNAQVEAFVTYDKLVNQFPDLLYLVPDDQREFNERITAYSINLVPALPDTPKFAIKQ
ncbi:MAG: metallophosphoesterase [Chitinophagaceae bacterium]|nr:MAG: metallophosphoesterase [Chitinophagaceae bacterium]